MSNYHSTVLTGCIKHGEEANLPQKPTADENFQDSVVLVWWDPDNHIGGFHRLGHEPNYKTGGISNLWSSIGLPSGIVKRTLITPLRKKDSLPNGFGSGDDTTTAVYKNGQHIWTINDPDLDLKAQLIHKDTGPNVDCFPKKSNVTETFAAGHLDIAGTLTGTVSHKGKTYTIRNGLSIRDHGWGVRDWGSALLTHRWIVGTAGPSFSVFIVAWHSADDRYAKFGWVVRDSVVTIAKDIDIATYVEDDGLTNRGGKTELELVTGEKYTIDWEPVAEGFLSHYRGVNNLDRLVSFKAVGDGKEFHGFGDYENTANITAGTRKPSLLIGSIINDGFTPK